MSTKQTRKQGIARFINNEYRKIISFIQRNKPPTTYQEAEDILGDVLVNIFRLINFGTIIDEIPGYLYRSIRNKIIDLSRAEKYRYTEIPAAPYPFGAGEEPVRRDGATIFESNEMKDTVLAAVQSLSPPQQAVWLGTEVENRSYEDLARQTGKSLNHLYVLKNRANKKIKKIMESYLSKGGIQ